MKIKKVKNKSKSKNKSKNKNKNKKTTKRQGLFMNNILNKISDKFKKGKNKTNKKNNKKKSNKGKTKKLPKICSPHINTKNNNNSCFDKSSLIKLIIEWNKTNTNNKIIFKESNSHTSLWNKLSNKMANKCNNEFCWTNKINSNDIKQLKKNIFRPSKPKLWEQKPREWLNTINIQDVMIQYEKKYKDFKFFGAVPIDFDLKSGFNQCIISELCKIDISNLYKNGKSKIGVVFNLDKHSESGSHWISMYTDINKEIIGYWDSYGYTPPKEVTKLMNKIKKQADTSLNKNMNIKINKKRHQYKNSECGMYSMYFIIEQLKGSSFDNICNNIIKDDDIFKKRKEYYNNLK